jgi:hypothetical protein
MAKLISISIDVTKMDKSRFINGKKGVYANLTVSLNDTPDQYGNDVAVWQSQTKEEREAKENRNFLGNGKVVWSSDNSPAQREHNQAKANGYQPDSDDMPF